MKKNEKIIDLREAEKPDFVINPAGQADATPVSEEEILAMNPQEKVKLRFGRFVNLVVGKSYEDIVEKHFDEEIVLSADLLADLANADSGYEEEDTKRPWVFVWGMVLGVVVAYFLFKF